LYLSFLLFIEAQTPETPHSKKSSIEAIARKEVHFKMSPASKTIYGQIIEYRKGKHIILLTVAVKVYAIITFWAPSIDNVRSSLGHEIKWRQTLHGIIRLQT
jgi:hypothetical protein